MTANHISLGVGAGTLLLIALSACSGSGSSATTATPPTARHPVAAPSATSSGTPTAGAPKSTTPATPHTGAPSSNPPATEFRPPGDIPDNQVFVDYRVPGSTVHIKVPEGWARSSVGGTTTFTDQYNSIAVSTTRAATAPTVASAQRADVARLRRTVSNFARGQVSMVQRQHGSAVLVTYFADSAQSPVTGKVVRDAVERYEFWRSGEEVIVTLTGPKGADNVDPWRTVTDSVTWT